MPEHHGLRNDVAIFIQGSDAIESGLIVLAAAESLTDEIAAYIMELVGFEDPSSVVEALHFCDFVFERNSEWNLAPDVREYLIGRLRERPELYRAAHDRLLAVCRSR